MAPHEACPHDFAALRAALDRPLREARAIWLDAMERAYVRHLLARHGGNVARAAVAATVDRTHLYRLIRKHERSTATEPESHGR